MRLTSEIPQPCTTVLEQPSQRAEAIFLCKMHHAKAVINRAGAGSRNLLICSKLESPFHGPKKKDTDHVNIKKMSAKSGQTSRGMTMLLLWAMLLSVAVFVPSAHGLAVEDEDQMRVLAMNEELFSAAQRGETMMVVMKLSDGAQPEGYKNDIKVTALIAASERGHTDVVRELLDKNASVTHQDAVMHPTRCPAACSCQ